MFLRNAYTFSQEGEGWRMLFSLAPLMFID